MFGLSTLTTIPAVAFYAAILAVALSSRVRDWVERYLSMPRPSNQRHLASLDALRGLAALLVAAFHGWQWPGAPPHTVPAFIENGTKAVPVFVALSGFLIYRAVLAVESGAQLRRYLRNRFFRIFPLYAASVVALAALGCLGDSESKLTEFLANFFMLRAFGSPLFANPPVWSLYVEVVFYLLLPVVVIAFGRRTPLAAAIGLAVLAVIDLPGPREFMLVKYFLIGILASETASRWQATREPVALAAVAIGVVLLILDAQFNLDWFNLLLRGGKTSAVLQSSGLTVGLAVALFFLLVGLTGSPAANRFFDQMPWRVFATISYSVFVWHSLVVISAAPVVFTGDGSIRLLPGPLPRVAPAGLFLVYLPAVCMLAALSFLAIERPFLNLKVRRRLLTAEVTASDSDIAENSR
jgi:peptidoglycan/LPS O-acetylase OafA/YrhL